MRSDSRWIRLAGMLVVLLSLSLSPVEASEASELTHWTDSVAVPWLAGQLTTHPRLKGQPVRVVALSGAVRTPAPDGLTNSTVQRIREALATRPGVLLVADAGADWRNYDGSRRIDCRPARERYLIGIEITTDGDSDARLIIRLLDLDDNTWAAGFVTTWDGRLERDERRLLRGRHPVEDLRGERALPFDPGQSDLVASRIAASLACDLLAHPAEDLRAAVVVDGAGSPAAMAATLVANYLARAGAVRLMSDPKFANVLISGETHPLGSDLHQLWVSVRPGQPDGDLPSLSSAVYVHEAALAVTVPGHTTLAPPSATVADANRSVALESLRIVRLPVPCRPGACAADGAEIDVDAVNVADPRLALEVATETGGNVALLALRPGRGLVRMDIAGCNGPKSVQLSPQERLRHPLFAHDPPADVTVFALATGSEEARLRLSRLLADVPSDCRGFGLAGRKLDRWLRNMERMASELESEMDWRGVRLGLDPASAQVASR